MLFCFGLGDLLRLCLGLLRGCPASRLLGLALSSDRLLGLRLLAHERRVCGVLEHPFDLHAHLLAYELGRAGHADVEALDLGDTRIGIVEADLDELDLGLVTFADRRRRRQLVALAFLEHDEVVEVRVFLADEVEAASRLLLELDQA